MWGRHLTLNNRSKQRKQTWIVRVHAASASWTWTPVKCAKLPSPPDEWSRSTFKLPHPGIWKSNASCNRVTIDFTLALTSIAQFKVLKRSGKRGVGGVCLLEAVIFDTRHTNTTEVTNFLRHFLLPTHTHTNAIWRPPSRNSICKKGKLQKTQLPS